MTQCCIRYPARRMELRKQALQRVDDTGKYWNHGQAPSSPTGNSARRDGAQRPDSETDAARGRTGATRQERQGAY